MVLVIRSVCGAGSLAAAAAARELARYKLYLVDVQEVKWDYGGAVRAGHYITLSFCQLRTKFYPTSCC